LAGQSIGWRQPGLGCPTWDAQIVADQPNRLSQWRTLPEATVQHAGQVQFNPVPTGRGTVREAV